MKRNSRFEADLHCHTTASDGLLTPTEIVELASSKGMKAIGITDHDTIDGWQEAERAAEKQTIKVIKGIEINTDWQQREIHILGYLLDDKSISFNKKIYELQHQRIIRIQEILSKLERLGMSITFEEVMEYAKGKAIGRPHVAHAMVKKGYVKDFREVFDSYLKAGGKAYVPRYKLTPTEAISIIREAQGVAVLAHPGSQQIEKEIRQWKDEGLQGIEVSHPDHSSEDSARYSELSEKLGLITTGGSDFHGKSLKPGIEIGNWGVSLEVVEQLERVKHTSLS